MDEGRITNYRYGLPGKISPPGLLHAMGDTDTGPHTDTDIHGTYRRQGTQCITTYIPYNGKFQFPEYMKSSPVGTTRTHYRWPSRHILHAYNLTLRFLTQESFPDYPAIQFSSDRQE